MSPPEIPEYLRIIWEHFIGFFEEFDSKSEVPLGDADKSTEVHPRRRIRMEVLCNLQRRFRIVEVSLVERDISELFVQTIIIRMSEEVFLDPFACLDILPLILQLLYLLDVFRTHSFLHSFWIFGEMKIIRRQYIDKFSFFNRLFEKYYTFAIYPLNLSTISSLTSSSICSKESNNAQIFHWNRIYFASSSRSPLELR